MNTQATTKQTPEAARVYAARGGQVVQLMKLLEREIDAHRAGAAQAAADWGFVGDLGNVRDGLINLVAFLRSQDPDRLKAEFAD